MLPAQSLAVKNGSFNFMSVIWLACKEQDGWCFGRENVSFMVLANHVLNHAILRVTVVKVFLGVSVATL